jgi:predicted nucleic acid-binding protein
MAAEYLLRTPVGNAAAALIHDADLFTPSLMDAEVLSALRRMFFAGQIGDTRAMQVLEDLRDWDVLRVDDTALLQVAWSLRQNVTGYDAMYVAAARVHSAELVTADGPLARAPALGIIIHNIRT